MMATLQEIQDYFVTDFHQCDHTVDEIGHGTHSAGTIAAVSLEASPNAQQKPPKKK